MPKARLGLVQSRWLCPVLLSSEVGPLSGIVAVAGTCADAGADVVQVQVPV